MLLYAVTDRAWLRGRTLAQQVEAALKGGATCVQLREKEADDGFFLEEAVQLAALCRRYKVPFIVNDRADIAVKCGADGVHVGQDDMAVSDVRRITGNGMLLGVSVRTVQEAGEAVRCGADYLGVGAMFPTDTKSDAGVVSKETVRDICRAVNVPVVAIGGIKRHNMAEFAGLGLSGFALVSAIFAAEDIEAECRLLRALAEKTVATV